MVMETNTCITCGLTKDIAHFSITQRKSNAALASGSTIRKNNAKYSDVVYRNQCKACAAEKAKAFRKRYKEKTGNSDYRGSDVNNYFPKEDKVLVSAIRKRISQAKGNIKRKNGEFNLSEQFMYQLYKQQQGLCSLTNVPMQINGNTNLRLSIDKLDPLKGYVEGNVQWTIFAANRAKGDLCQDDFIAMCTLIVERATTIERVTNRVE